MCPVSRRDIVQPKAQLMTAAAVAARLRHEFDVEQAWWDNWGEPLTHPLTRDMGRAFLRAVFASYTRPPTSPQTTVPCASASAGTFPAPRSPKAASL